MKKVSIVVPVYNAENYITDCVNALIGQSYSNLEIILVDDGSKDNSPQLCDNFAEIDQRIKVIHKKNGGVSCARNTGICMATGDYLMFADSDDSYEKNMVSRMVKLADIWDVNLVICSYRVVENAIEAITPINNTKLFEPVCAMTRDEVFNALGYMMACRETIFAPWNKLFSLEIVKENNVKFPEDISYGEDFLFNLQYLRYCNGVIETREKLYNYILQNPDSLEARYKPDLFENQTVLYRAAKEFMTIHNVYSNYNTYYLSYYYAKCIYNCILAQKNKKNKNTEFEKRIYVRSFFDSEDVLRAVFYANLQETPEQCIFTNLVKSERYDEIYDAIIRYQWEKNSGSGDTRYKVIPESGNGLKWIPLTLRSVKKYGLVITIQRIIGKILRKVKGK